ncbi:hypothetical protein FHS27_005824 [Rhodopirellula rubra]|uniref:Transmembrane protein n=1 Tax=Aporhodopirellula rubra TaxID=980271 RepID=A0A7W5H8Z8_9BACT|nr:hypothetical protein [Aporhodopirellula rubra]MBB3209978.1 hypothetical protein [Aporhodopirellula rubra]
MITLSRSVAGTSWPRHRVRWRNLAFSLFIAALSSAWLASVSYAQTVPPVDQPVEKQPADEKKTVAAISSEETDASEETGAPDEISAAEDASADPATEKMNAGDADLKGDGDVSDEPMEAEPEETDEEAEAIETPMRLDHPLAASQWRRRKPRWIALYGSQLADMIPQSFRPISIEDLAAALRDAPQSALQISNAPVSRLVMVAHVDENYLVSRASRLVLPQSQDVNENDSDEFARTQVAMRRYRLGPLNLNLIETDSDLAVTERLAETGTEVGVKTDERIGSRIVSDVSGECYALGPVGGTIDFEWSSRCQHVTRGRRWTLRLPDATVTQFYLRVGQREVLDAEGGSVVRLDEPPSVDDLGFALAGSENDESAATIQPSGGNWYLIEPTPGQMLTLLLRSSNEENADDSRGPTSIADDTSHDPTMISVVRGCRLQAQWMGNQLRWSYRLTLDANDEIELSELGWANADVTAVRRDNIEVPFEWTEGRVRWTNPIGSGSATRTGTGATSGNASTTLVFEGVSKQRGKQLWLPRPLLPPDQFFVPPQTWQIQLEVPSWSVFNEVQLPDGWSVRTLPGDFVRAGDRIGVATPTGMSGELSADPTSTWMASGPPPRADDPWSVSISQNDALVFANHQVRFEMDETSIQARGKVTIEMPQGSVRPIVLEIQDGFQFEFVGVGEARRSVPTGPPVGRGRRLTIWPGGNEVVDNRVSVYVTARARRSNLYRRSNDAGQNEAIAKENTERNDNGAQRDVAGVLVDSEDLNVPQAASDLITLPGNANTPPSQPDPASLPRESGVNPPGNRGAAIAGQSIQRVDALWLIRAVDCPGQMLAAIIPPSNLSWSAKAAIEPSRKAFSDLTAEQRRFFAPLPGDAIVFGGAIEATPAVSLEKPDVNLSVSLRTLLRGGRTTPIGRPLERVTLQSESPQRPLPSDHVWQTLEVKTEGTAGEIRSMRLRFAADPKSSKANGGGDPTPPPSWSAMQWSVQLQANQPEFAIDDDAVTRQFIDGVNSWEVRVALPPRFTNQSLLIGRRRQRIDHVGSKLTIGLPNVPDAASQSAEVWIDPSLQLSRNFDALKGVPTLDNAKASRSEPLVSSRVRWSRPDAPIAETARYRYEPNDRPWIEVMPRSHHSPTGLIVGQRLAAVASVNGTDMLKLTCLVRSNSEMELTYPLSLHLVEVRRDGELVTPRIIPGRGIVLPSPVPVNNVASAALARPTTQESPPPKSALSQSSVTPPRWTRLEVSWISPATRGSWYRWFRYPDIQLDQLVVDARRELVAATGTTVIQLSAAPWGVSGMTRPLLLPAGFLGSIGWVVAFILLGLARMVGHRGFITIAAGIILAVSAALLWPSTALPLIAFVAMPLTLAALQLATTDWMRERKAAEAGLGSSSLSKAVSHSADRVSGRREPSSAVVPVGREFGGARSRGEQTPKTPPANTPAPNVPSDSWTRKFDAGEIISSELHTDDIVGGDGSSREESESEPGSGDDFSSSSIVPVLIGFAVTLATWFGGDNVAAQTPLIGPPTVVPNATTVKERTPPTIDVLVPLQRDGEMLGNKIYIPEAFYNELFFSDVRSQIQSPMIQNVSYDLKLRSPLQPDVGPALGALPRSGFPSVGTTETEGGLFESANETNRRNQPGLGGNRASLTAEKLRQTGVAKLTAKIGLVLPPETRRLRLPYRFEQVIGVARVQSGVERQTLRWGDDGEGWVWVEMPSSERDFEAVRSAEIVLSLQCQFEWESPWVLVSATLPPLSAANLNVSAGDDVESVMLQNQTSSWVVDLQSDDTLEGSLATSSSTSNGYSQVADVIYLGPTRRLSLRYQFRDAASDTTKSSAPTLPWDDENYWQKRFWVHSQAGKTVIECEIQPRSPLPPEAIVALSTTVPEVQGVDSFDDIDGPIHPGFGEENSTDDDALDKATKDAGSAAKLLGDNESIDGRDAESRETAQCKLLTQHWSRQKPDSGSDMQTLRLMSLATPTRPIRLGWTLATPKDGVWRIRMPKVKIGAEGIAARDALSVPVVTPEGAAEFAPDAALSPLRRAADESLPWVAWTIANDLQPDWSQIGGLEPLAVDQFYAKWTGYLSSINRAAVGTVTDLTLRRIAKPKTPLTTKHEISIDNDSQRVEFFAEVNGPKTGTSTSVGATRYAVDLPVGARLLDWKFEPIGDESATAFAANGQTNGAGEFPGGTEFDDASSIPLDRNSNGSTNESGTQPVVQPWTVSKRGKITTLLLTSDQVGFRVKVNAVLPLSAGGRDNRLPLMHLTKIMKAGDGAQADDRDESTDFDQSHELLITRSIDAFVNWTRPVGGQKLDAGVEDAASLLTSGKVLVDRFATTGPIQDAFASARFRVRRNNRPFDVDSRITLRWEEGRWTAQTDCVITSEYCPDYLDIALPTRWCDSLQIVPLCISSRQPTLDPALQVLRLELRRDDATPEVDTGGEKPEDSDGQHVRSFRLISRLAVSEITRVSVPEIRIMDVRRHRIDVVVPTRLTNEQVRWRSNFAGPIEKPRWRSDGALEQYTNAASVVSSGDSDASASGVESNAELSVYAVTSPGWSIDLETLPRTDRIAELIHADHRVLVRPQSEHWLMVSRFDLLPGDQSSVRLSVPAVADLVGVWAGTRAADLRRVSGSPLASGDTAQNEVTETSVDAGEVIWDVPLPLSRLSQTVEVLIAFPKDLGNVLMPTLVGLATDDTESSVDWCEIPLQSTVLGQSVEPSDEMMDAIRSDAAKGEAVDGESIGDVTVGGNTGGGGQSRGAISSITSQTRLRWLASCVVEAIRSSSDALADRRDEEVAVWLRPWILRYRMLCDAAGRRIGGPVKENSTDSDSDSDAVESDGTPLPADSDDVISKPLLSWEEMDAYILSQETRYFSLDAFLADAVPNLDPSVSDGGLRSSNPSSRLGDLALAGRDSSTTWSDFLAVTTPPGFVDRWTFVWKGRRLPVQLLAQQRTPLSEYARQQVLRGGIFVALAGLVLIAVLIPRNRSRDEKNEPELPEWLPRVNWDHPSLWLFVLSGIGFMLMPIPMAAGLMLAAVVLGGSDWSRKWIVSRFHLRSNNVVKTGSAMKSGNAIHSGNAMKSNRELK